MTQAQAKPLCSTRPEFQKLIRLVAKFDGTQTVQVKDGEVKCSGEDAYGGVAWGTARADDGCYQCTVDKTSSAVTLLTPNAPTFENPMVRSDVLQRCVRKGRRAGAIRCTDELSVCGPWQHLSPDATFALNDDEYFVNTSRDATGMITTDLHFHMPEMDVTIDQALYMREALIHMLSASVEGRFALSGWANALPTPCYTTAVTTCTGSGLRMYGANKTVECLQCRKRSRDDDMACPVPGCKQGKVDLKNPFRLKNVFIDGAEQSDRRRHYELHLKQFVKKTAIRTFLKDPAPNWSRFDGCPQYGDIIKKAGTSGEEVLYRMTGNEAVVKVKAPLRASDLAEVSDRSIWKAFEACIRRYHRKHAYASLRVVGVRYSDAKKIYFINVAGIGQHWCLNLLPPADHTESRIYFQCSRQQGIQQRCTCNDPSVEGRHAGVCKMFKGKTGTLSLRERTLLFG